MMNQKIISILIAIIILTTSACKMSQSLHSEQQKYLPICISKLNLGMTLDDFKKNRNSPDIEYQIGEFVSYVIEQVNKDDITWIQYQFDGKNILYEFIIEYNDKFNVLDDFTKKHGNPNDGTEWSFDSKEGYKIKIWIFSNRLCIGDARHF